MTSDATAYDVTTREGWLQRAIDTTDRRIPQRFRSATVTNPEIAAWCRTYGPTSDSLLLLGVTGAGKTWQAFGAIRTLAARGAQAEWAAVTAPDLYALLRPRDGVDSETEFRRWADVPLLLIDDLGAAKNSEFAEGVNYRLVDRRSKAMTPCLITSNVPVGQLRAMLGDRVASRLREMCRFIEIDGPDQRKAPR